MGLFESFILHEAPDNPPNFVNPPKQQDQQQSDPNAQQQSPPEESQSAPPDVGGGDAPAADDQGNTPAPDVQDDAAGGEEGDQQQDPNAEGGEEVAPPEQQGDELEQDEQEVFSDLKPRQMEIKNKELKDQYKTLSMDISGALEKIGKISHTETDDALLDFIVRKLIELRDASRDSLLYTFDTRTYVENQIHLQKMITTYNIITNMITSISDYRYQRKMEFEKKSNGFSRDGDFPFVFTKGLDLQ